VLGQRPISECPQDRAPEISTSETTGKAIVAMAVMAGAISGLRNAICCGTSSPITKEK
jgi:hypothetical protein